MTFKKTFSTLLLAAILCAPFSISAQVTIGSDRAPSPWSLLDLCTREQQRALHNARMDTEQRDSLMNEDWQPATERIEAQGLMIFNTDNDGCLEFWSGSRWVSLCEGDTPCYRIASINHLPTSREVTVNVDNTTATLTVTPVGGTPPFEFQWFDSNGRIDSATDSIFTTLNNLSAGTHTFYAVITNCEGARTKTSELFTVIVTCYPINSVLHNGQAIPQVINKQLGATAARLEVTPVGGSAPHSRVQWFRNNAEITNATSLVYTTINTLPAGRHYFFAEIWNCDNTYSIRSEVFVVDVRNWTDIDDFTGATFIGRTCFDIARGNPSGNCGTVANRLPEQRNFTLNNTETYTLVDNVPSVMNVYIGDDLHFKFVNLQATAVIDSIRQLANNQVRVYFNPQLDSLARYRNRANALLANLHAFYHCTAIAEIQRRVSVLIRVSDCACCPGLFIPGGAWTVRPEFLNPQGFLNPLPEGSTNVTAPPGNIRQQSLAVMSAFVRTGDLCVYYRDFSTIPNTVPTANTGWILWWNATNNGADMSWVCGNISGQHSGMGVDERHAHPEWRMPNIAELAQLRYMFGYWAASYPQQRVDHSIFMKYRTGLGPRESILPIGSRVESDAWYIAPFWRHSSTHWSMAGFPVWWSWQGSHAVSRNSLLSNELLLRGALRCVRNF